MRWLDSITDAMDRNLGKLQETVRDREARHAAVHEVTKSDMTGRLNGGAYICMYICICICYACTLCLTHIHFYLVNAHLYLEYTSINTYKANIIIFLCLRISSLILSLLASTLANTLIRKRWVEREGYFQCGWKQTFILFYREVWSCHYPSVLSQTDPEQPGPGVPHQPALTEDHPRRGYNSG